MKKEDNSGNGPPVASSGRPVATKVGSFSRRMLGKALAWYRAKSPVLMFVLVLTGLMAAYYAATLTPLFQQKFFPGCMRLNALLSNVLLHRLGQGTTVIGASIFSQRFGVDVARGCDAIDPSVLFVSAVLAFPSPLRRKIAGVLVGVPVLLAVNLVRIVTLFLTGVYYPKAFHAMHADVWQIAFILLAIVFWVVWIQWALHRPEPGPNAVN